MMDTIEKNLYEFYRIFASVKNISLESGDGFEMIDAKEKFWPQMMFNLNQDKSPVEVIPGIKAILENKKLSPFIIAPESYISKNHAELLKSNGIIPVKVLMGMNFKFESFEDFELPIKHEVCDLVREEQLIEFTQLIQKEFFTSGLTFQDNILTEIQDCKEITMSGLYFDNQLISSMLICTTENIAGLYFIVTTKEVQKKGFATILIRSVLKQLYEKGIKEVVLHANNNSFGLYQKLGFTWQNKFVIYKKI